MSQKLNKTKSADTLHGRFNALAARLTAGSSATMVLKERDLFGKVQIKKVQNKYGYYNNKEQRCSKLYRMQLLNIQEFKTRDFQVPICHPYICVEFAVFTYFSVMIVVNMAMHDNGACDTSEAKGR